LTAIPSSGPLHKSPFATKPAPGLLAAGPVSIGPTGFGLGKFFNTTTNHIMHHQHIRMNYGLYFNFWDRLMGTNHPQYEARFTELTLARPRS
jgi:hypothetical protein